MAITKQFRDTIMNRAKKDPVFRREMLRKAIELFLNDEMDLAKSLLRDYINATIQFKTLSRNLDQESKSLQRMLGPRGNPTAKNLFAIIRVLQKAEGVQLKVTL